MFMKEKRFNGFKNRRNAKLNTCVRGVNIIIILLLFHIPNIVVGQKINQTWYTPIRNNLLQIIITDDSILFGKNNFDLRLKEFRMDLRFKIEKTNLNHFLVSEYIDSTKKYSIIGYKQDPNKLLLNINSLNEKYSSLLEAEKQIETFKEYPIYVQFIDSTSIAEIRKKENLESMTINDFKNYANKIIAVDSSISKIKKRKYRLAYLYKESINRLIVSECGYNSLVKGIKFDSIILKFADLPETKEIFETMLNPK